MGGSVNIGQLIGQVGENPNFIAFQAHCWFAFSCVVTATHFHVPLVVAATCAAALAAVKEFWFDIRYETAQTYTDGALDFAGYAAGIALGALL